MIEYKDDVLNIKVLGIYEMLERIALNTGTPVEELKKKSVNEIIKMNNDICAKTLKHYFEE